MNYNEMSSAQCADWLAEREQFERSPCGLWRSTITGIIVAHPFPLTLDDAAGALREPWMLVRLDVSKSGRALAVIYCESPEKWEHMSGPDELTARYRAAVAARMEDER